jgi:hypothetical protein
MFGDAQNAITVRARARTDRRLFVHEGLVSRPARRSPRASYTDSPSSGCAIAAPTAFINAAIPSIFRLDVSLSGLMVRWIAPAVTSRIDREHASERREERSRAERGIGAFSGRESVESGSLALKFRLVRLAVRQFAFRTFSQSSRMLPGGNRHAGVRTLRICHCRASASR